METERQTNQKRNTDNQHKTNKKPGKNTSYRSKQQSQPPKDVPNEVQTQSGIDDIYESTEERSENSPVNRKTEISLPARDDSRSLNASQSSIATNLSSRSELRGSKGTNIDDEELCLMCLDPILFWAFGKCNHKETCALCAIRRRVLYGHLECPVCRETLETVVISNEEKSYEDYAPFLKDMGFDPKSKSYYSGPSAAHFAQLSKLWELHCPLGCDFRGKNIALLKKHVAEQHNMKYCNVCLQDRKVFLQEQKLYSPKRLRAHLEVGDEEPKIKHEECQFCNKYFFDMEKLYDHMHKNHETCFICQRHPSSMHQYYRNYQTLEQHFRGEHFLCEEPECLSKKFVVFEDAQQLKLHQAAEHKGFTRKAARGQVVVDLDFNKRSTRNEVTPSEDNSSQPPIEDIVSSEESFPALQGGVPAPTSVSIGPPSWARPRTTDFSSEQDFPTLPPPSKTSTSAPKKPQTSNVSNNHNGKDSKPQEEYPSLSSTAKKPPTTTTYKPSTSQPTKLSYHNNDSDDEEAYPALGSASPSPFNPTWGQPTVEVISAAQFSQQQETTNNSWAKSNKAPNLEKDFPTLSGHPKSSAAAAPRAWGPSSSSNVSTHEGRLIIQSKKKGKKK